MENASAQSLFPRDEPVTGGMAAVIAFAACVVGHVCSSRYLSRYKWYVSKPPAERAYLDQLVVSCPAISCTVLMFARGMWMLPAGMLARQFGTTHMHATAMDVAIGFHIYEVCLYVLHGKKLVFWVHHLLALGAIVTSRLTEQQMQIIAWQYSCEVTGVPLAAVLLMQQDPALKASTAYTVAGAVLWVTWLFARVISLLACTAFFGHDLFYALPAIGRLDDLHWIHKYLALPSTVIIWGMSLVWFWPITLGILKALGVIEAKSAKAKS